jgi:hypothetical protein
MTSRSVCVSQAKVSSPSELNGFYIGSALAVNARIFLAIQRPRKVRQQSP